MKEVLKVSLVQCQQFWEDKFRNFAHLDNVIDPILEPDIILLPEMFHTGFSMNPAELSEDMEGYAIQWLRKSAKKKQSAFYTSFICKEEDNYFNRGVFVTKEGEITCYDKRQCFSLAGEDKIYQAGENETIIDYCGWKLNLQICYDLRFPELVRNSLSLDGVPKYDVLLYVANWPQPRISHWDALLKARAIENQCYVLGANRVGKDGNGLLYSGESISYNLLGEALNEIVKNEEIVLNIALDYQDLVINRKKLPFLKDNKLPFS
jgi:omega-amidase